MSNKYCNSLNKYSRFKTKVVNIGHVPVGGTYPIRLQSMTTTNTLDIKATVNQSIQIINAGSDYVRITAPSIREAQVLRDIKDSLKRKGYNTPLIADIHFTPNAAIEAAKYVEKVRINPGNYVDRRKFKTFEYTDLDYNDELERVYQRFSPLIKICKEYGTAMRIGANHGSLSDRIMNRYGDTPLGMVESAMEFLRICEDNNYYNIVLSMKSSNPIIMVQAYRLLINSMINENMNYPLHLGVTEAGEGMEGRIKSAVGIGTLLEDGLGDTIRVSLTESPELEIPVARMIVDRYRSRTDHKTINFKNNNILTPFSYSKRLTSLVDNFGYNNVPRVIIDASLINKKIDSSFLSSIGYKYDNKNDKWFIKDLAADYIYLGDANINCIIPEQLKVICSYSEWIKNINNRYPLMNLAEYKKNNIVSMKFLCLSSDSIIDNDVIEKLSNDKSVVLIINTDNDHGMVEQRNLFTKFMKFKIDVPIVISRNYYDMPINEIQVNASIDIGGLLVDGLGDGICIMHNKREFNHIKNINKLSFQLLQATRTRITKTDYISCPSCGRTQFDLIETTALVREKTSHLKGLKIAIMGCIVNGPGEMADADYGYVGTGKGLISLYKKHNVVKKNIPAKDSVFELIELIKDNGDWEDVIQN